MLATTLAQVAEGGRRAARQRVLRDARELAINLFAGVQGGALLANALRDPDLMTAQVRHLERWIDSVS